MIPFLDQIQPDEKKETPTAAMLQHTKYQSFRQTAAIFQEQW